jgi:hypothetical protein
MDALFEANPQNSPSYQRRSFSVVRNTSEMLINFTRGDPRNVNNLGNVTCEPTVSESPIQTSLVRKDRI